MGNFTVDTSGFGNALAGGTFSVAQDGNNLDVKFQPGPVPEPGTMAVMLAGLGALAAVGAYRRRRAV